MPSSQKISNYWQKVKESFSELNLNFFKKSFSGAFQNIVRNRLISLSSIFVLTIILVLFHVSLALKFFADEALVSLNKKVDLILEVKQEADSSELLSFKNEIEKQSGVVSVSLVSKEEALEGFLKRHENIKRFLEKYKLENPLPSTLEVRTQDPTDLQSLIIFVQSQKYEEIIDISKITGDIQQKASMEKLINLGGFIKKMSFGFMILFIFVSVLVIFNTISVAIHSRKEEIHSMHLVGATKQFIQAPFIFEGIIYSFFSLFFALIVDLLLHFQFMNIIENSLTNESLSIGISAIMNEFLFNYPSYIFFEGTLLIFCSVISSFIAIELYLRRMSY